jgi:hypothetical protein
VGSVGKPRKCLRLGLIRGTWESMNSTLVVVYDAVSVLISPPPQLRPLVVWSGDCIERVPGGYGLFTLLLVFVLGTCLGRLWALVQCPLRALVRQRQARRRRDQDNFDPGLQRKWERLSHKAVFQPVRDQILKSREREWGLRGQKIQKHPWHKECRERTKYKKIVAAVTRTIWTCRTAKKKR